MANKYKLNLTDDHIAALNDDPQMEGVSLEATDESGKKVLITLFKNNALLKPTEINLPNEKEIGNIGNISPEEDAARLAAIETENIGFTNESTISSFYKFLKY
jgi:hypothetical protein